MTISEESSLTEVVNPDLLDEDQRFTYLFIESDNVSVIAPEVALQNPFSFDLSRFLPNQIHMTLPVFFSVASQVIQDAQIREGVVASERVKLVEEYPAVPMSDLGDEVVAWRVLRREPAKMNTKGTGRPHRASTWSYDLQTRYAPNKVIVVESRPIDHLIEFSCWAKTCALANRRALWLEKLFIAHAWAFQVEGAERFFWENRGPDTYMTSGGQRLFTRPVNFFLRLREFEMKSLPTLRTINFEIETE